MKYLLALFISITVSICFAQGGLKGRVLNQDGEPLPYATIYIKQMGSGSISGARGQYELRLAPGSYDISFQFLGYATERVSVEVAGEMITRDIILPKQAYRLTAAEVKAGKEDPAYPIMRKAIAKSKFHSQQLDAYSCEVYLKGGGRIVDMPKLFWKIAEMDGEEGGGVDTSASFITESVSKITYTRPAQYNEEVISIRTTGDSRNSNPMAYINGSFYEPKVAGIVSPLSPRAFGYYKFQYLSSYTDGGHTINKINVIPRRRNEDVVTGVLHLVEGIWSIHSFEFDLLIQGIKVEARQVFAPVEENVWLPVSHKYDGEGKIFGVEFEFGYLAAVSDYDITVNPDLSVPIVVIDEKTEQDELEERESKPDISGKELSNSVEKKLESGEELSRKELMKLMRKYEKEERKKRDEPEVERIKQFKIDSTAYDADSTFWENRRPVPLDTRELRGYTVQDSLAEERKKRAEGDTLGRDSKKFGLGAILLGTEYKLGNENYLKLHSPLPSVGYNTVDGYNFEYRVSYFKRFENKSRFEISPMGRMIAARRQTMGTIRSRYNYQNGPRKGELSMEGGWYYSQFNPNEPIPPFQNNVSTLFFQNNFMKVYDRNFAHLKWKHDFRRNLVITPEIWYEERTETFNNTSGVWFPIEGQGFIPNAPVNLEMPNTSFGRSEAFKARMSVTYLPGRRYSKMNENYFESKRGPEFTAQITRAIPDVYRSTIDYTFASLTFKHYFDLRTGGRLGVRAEGGMFFSTNNMEFPDFAHFMGNQTIFTRFGQINGYSLLEYYDFSTDDRYLSAYLNYTGREFLLTRIGVLRMSGLKENINFNYLKTPFSDHYMEVGYSLTNIFRFGRVDFVAGFTDHGYREFRVQFGIQSEFFQMR